MGNDDPGNDLPITEMEAALDVVGAQKRLTVVVDKGPVRRVQEERKGGGWEGKESHPVECACESWVPSAKYVRTCVRACTEKGSELVVAEVQTYTHPYHPHKHTHTHTHTALSLCSVSQLARPLARLPAPKSVPASTAAAPMSARRCVCVLLLPNSALQAHLASGERHRDTWQDFI